MNRYLIGDQLVQAAGIPLSRREQYLEQFRYDGPWDGDCLTIRGRVEPLEPYLTDRIGRDNGVYEIYRHGTELLLSYHWGNQFHGFLIWPERFAVSFPPQMVHQPQIPDDWFFSISGFHRQLLMRQSGVLHAAYIDAGGTAILFTAPSGTGKSTQAALWERYAGAEIINGDRVVLGRRGENWHAYGYPCCGSSGICRNRTLPLGAIVVLEQGPDNVVLPMAAGQKIRALAAAMECYHWDQEEMNLVFDLAMALAARVPVVRLRCRPDADAVQVLKDYLTGEGILNGI